MVSFVGDGTGVTWASVGAVVSIITDPLPENAEGLPTTSNAFTFMYQVPWAKTVVWVKELVVTEAELVSPPAVVDQ